MRRRMPLLLVGLSLLVTPASAPAQTAFRITDLDLKDPHTFFNPIVCTDFTNLAAFGVLGVNPGLDAAMEGDSDGDGLLDLSFVLVFPTPFGGPLWFGRSECTAPMTGTSCPLPAPATIATITEQTVGTCLGPIAGTVRPYNPAVTSASAPCFVTAVISSLTLDLGLVTLPLRDVRIAATRVGDPPTGLANGLLRGFLTREDAEVTTLEVEPGQFETLASLLRGGVGCCSEPAPIIGDRDMNGPATGWWIYFNFTASAITAPAQVAVDPAAVAAIELLGAPNPFRHSAMVRYALPAAGEVRLTVYDTGGRRVRDLFRGVQDAGAHVATWDGRDAKGAPAAAGVYLVRLEAGALTRTLKIARLH